jgi:hypothetical protein
MPMAAGGVRHRAKSVAASEAVALVRCGVPRQPSACDSARMPHRPRPCDTGGAGLAIRDDCRYRNHHPARIESRILSSSCRMLGMTDKAPWTVRLTPQRMRDTVAVVRIVRGRAFEQMLDEPRFYLVVNTDSPFQLVGGTLD